MLNEADENLTNKYVVSYCMQRYVRFIISASSDKHNLFSTIFKFYFVFIFKFYFVLSGAFPPFRRNIKLVLRYTAVTKFQEEPSAGVQNTGVRFPIFDRNRRLSQKRYEIGPWLLRNSHRKSYVADRSLLVPLYLE